MIGRRQLARMTLGLAGASLLAGPGAADEIPPRPGRVEVIAAFPSAFVAARTVRVWLPPGYDGGTGRYPVLYMHDGQNLFDPALAMGHETWSPDIVLTGLAAGGRAPQAIIVGIDNTPARAREYMPAQVFATLAPDVRDRLALTMGGPPLSDDYLRFLVRELKPMIDARFRTRPERASTVIMGSSMGALISLQAIVDYPRVFGAAGCLSTHWPLPAFTAEGTPSLTAAQVLPAFETWLAARLSAPKSRRIWFDHGDRTLDRFYAPYQAAIDSLFR
jgi:enterochelin esterase-like enzyme